MKAFRLFLLFGISGVVGFVVDTAVLYLLKDFLGLYAGRVCSFFCAVFSTWLVNRNLTFRNRQSGLSVGSEFSRYAVLMLGGGLLNYAIYALLVEKFRIVEDNPILGVAAGSLGGMVLNLISSRFLLFRFSARKHAK